MGYGSGAYVLELLGGSLTDACETPEQKFNRLQCEIEELTQQLTAIQVETSWTAFHLLRAVFWYEIDK